MASLTSKLDAVNTVLSARSKAPVNSLENITRVDVNTAINHLDDASREVQSEGWHFNRNDNYSITPTVDGEIELPANVLSVDTVGISSSLDLVQRGLKLFDKKNNTYKISKTVVVDMVVLLDFEELPEAARTYIKRKAARRYQQKSSGSEVLSSFDVDDEALALVILLELENENADHNIVSSSFDVAKCVNRKRLMKG